MANLFFISDTHFGHENILTFKGSEGELIRPFSSAEEMDELMVQRWNETVREGDHVYHLGDVTMDRKFLPILARLNGRLRLVRGNHDIFRTKFYLQYFDEVYGVRVLDNYIFSHIPLHPQSMGRFAGNVHGHLHNNPSPEPVMRLDKVSQKVTWAPYISVCVEQTLYRPLSFEEVRQKGRDLTAGL